jgi:hypothetical protein
MIQKQTQHQEILPVYNQEIKTQSKFEKSSQNYCNFQLDLNKKA